MKTISEIKRTRRILVMRDGDDGGWASVHLLSSKKAHPATVVFSWGGDWDHVSVSFPNRTPTWEEMCEIKHMFFYPEETAWEYHPMESEYVDDHPYCLHIWRYQKQDIPTPPSWMIGRKKGQTWSDVYKRSQEDCNE